jgi:hypothetical protein
MEAKGRPKDKHSSTGVFGSPKKGGAGGKGTWGVGGLDDLKAVSISGRKDPNYDSEDEEVEEVVITKTEVATPTEIIIRELLLSGDIPETIKSLKDLNDDRLHEQFVKKAIVTAMEKQAYERELVSKLLCASYNVAITGEKLAGGFQAALDYLDDMVLDTPDAEEILSKFLARAIIDEIVAPAFLSYAVAASPLAEKCIHLAHSLVNQPFRSERLAHVWGAGDLGSVKRLKEEATLVFEEYLTNGDLNAADQNVRELNAPHFHPQLVKQALRLALTKDEENRNKILSLLAFFSSSDLISKDHLKKGFSYCLESIDDLRLDVPNAPTVLAGFIQKAKSEGWLDKNFQQPQI